MDGSAARFRFDAGGNSEGRMGDVSHDDDVPVWRRLDKTFVKGDEMKSMATDEEHGMDGMRVVCVWDGAEMDGNGNIFVSHFGRLNGMLS